MKTVPQEVRLLGENDLSKLVEFIVKKDIDNPGVYISPYITKEYFNELNLRNGLFNYSMLPFVLMENDQICKLMLFEIPEIFEQSTYITATFISGYTDLEFDNFFEKCTINLKEDFPEYSKIKVLIKEDDNICDILKKLNFESECFLKNELGIDKHCSVLSYIL